MHSYGKMSKKRLESCHTDLQFIFDMVIDRIDCSILEGRRSKELQNRYFEEGKSKVKWPDGKHNRFLSQAVDAAPYPWNFEKPDMSKLHFFAGIVMTTAWEYDIKLRWGGDWDGDLDFNDQNFNDLYHFELTGH